MVKLDRQMRWLLKPVSRGTLDLLTSPYSSSILCFGYFFYFLLTKALHILQNLGTIFILLSEIEN